ncbi:MAG: hypothetical protein Q9165_008737 [Trypethelium subeluteriae]
MFATIITLLSATVLLVFQVHADAIPHSPLASSPAPLPLILWHGLGDNYHADGIQDVLSLAQEVHPKTFTYAIRLDEDPSSDRTASFIGNTTTQIEQVCNDIASHPVLGKAPAVDALGFSQGGVLLRALVERCGDRIKVRSLVTFGSPHSGISQYQNCKPLDFLCKGAFGLLRGNTWSAFVQNRLVPAQYFREIEDDTGEPTEAYLEYSNLLADVNNEGKEKNTTYKKHLGAIERLVMYQFEEEDAVHEPESTWFGDVWIKPKPENDSDEAQERVVTPLKERALYKEDWLGLKALDEKGGLIFKTTPGKHMQIGDDDLIYVFKNFFGPSTDGGVGNIPAVWTDERLEGLTRPASKDDYTRDILDFWTKAFKDPDIQYLPSDFDVDEEDWIYYDLKYRVFTGQLYNDFQKALADDLGSSGGDQTQQVFNGDAVKATDAPSTDFMPKDGYWAQFTNEIWERSWFQGAYYRVNQEQELPNFDKETMQLWFEAWCMYIRVLQADPPGGAPLDAWNSRGDVGYMIGRALRLVKDQVERKTWLREYMEKRTVQWIHLQERNWEDGVEGWKWDGGFLVPVDWKGDRVHLCQAEKQCGHM